MGNTPKPGRPAKTRIPAAGEHLRHALRVLGKTWRKNTKDPDHVLNWPAWTAAGLPRSATTIDADIHLGIPEERMAAYAQCLGLSPRALASPETDVRAFLGSERAETGATLPPLANGFGPSFQDDYLAYNHPSYLSELFALVGGVYRVSYLLSISDNIYRCAFWFCSVGRSCIQGRGFFMMFGLENFFTSSTFRWHNNLHSMFLCDNRKELGYYMLIDPLRHNLIMRRTPFWLRGQGMTDSGLADNAPVPFTLRMEKRAPAEAQAEGQAWDRECDDVRRRPAIHSEDADYAAMRDAILAPDALL